MTTSPTEVMARTGFDLTSPGTNNRLVVDGDDLVAADGRRHRCHDGVWDFIRPDRLAEVNAFSVDYAAVRQAEHRTPLTPKAVRALPYEDLSGRMPEMWAERAASFDRFLVELPHHKPGTVLDVGAGCGWLGARMAARGWTAAAVDVTVDGGDGLATARWHREPLLLARAEMDALPFATSSVDLVVFNASLHYAAEITAALDEAVRVAVDGGLVVIMDSPVFSDPAAGDAMVEEFAARAEATLGVRPAPPFGPGYVTESDLVRFRRRHRPESFVRVDDRSGLVGRLRLVLGARRAGREIARRPLVVVRTKAEVLR